MQNTATNAAYQGLIFDGDTHIWERDYGFMKEYLPRQYHGEWLPARKAGPDGRFGLHVGERMVENAESNAQGLVPPPGRLKEWLKAMKEGKSNVEGWIQPTPDMMERDARIKKLDEFGVDGSILFVGEFVSTFGYYTNPQAGQVIQQAATALAAKAASKALGPGQSQADQSAAELAELKRALDPAKK